MPVPKPPVGKALLRFMRIFWDTGSHRCDEFIFRTLFAALEFKLFQTPAAARRRSV